MEAELPVQLFSEATDPGITPDGLEALLQRGDRAYLAKRLSLQAILQTEGYRRHKRALYWENFKGPPALLKSLLKITGLLPQAERNTLDFQVEQVDVPLKSLPPAFEGYRILHLSDLHIDAMLDGGERLIQLISTLQFDLCVMTGDYRFKILGDWSPTVAVMHRLLESIHCPDGVFGVLGNHDYVEMVPELERSGLRILLNEAVNVQRDNDRLWIAGVDDPHYYELHNLPKAFHGVAPTETTVLLVHSPEIIPEAAQAGADLYLCGHSHGGQVCLPGGIALFTNSRCERRYTSGRWRYAQMQGYTSRGTGSSGLQVRLVCPPEIALHRLVGLR